MSELKIKTQKRQVAVVEIEMANCEKLLLRLKLSS
jgi:hypothetical protein